MQEIFNLWPFFIMAFVGSLIHIIAKFAELEKTKRSFNPGKWIKKNIFRTILGILLSLGGVILLNEVGELSYAAVLLAGYTGDSLMKKGQKD